MQPDSIISRIYTENASSSYDPQRNLKDKNLVQKEFYATPKATRLVVFIPPWHPDPLLSRILVSRLRKKGFSILLYNFSAALLSKDKDLTVKYFKRVRDLIKKDIEEIREVYHFSEIVVTSMSIGAVIALMVSNNDPHVTSLRLIVPGSSLAASMWSGIRTQGLRACYEEQSISLAELEAAWHDLAPKNNIQHLFCKDIYIEIAKNDLVIPYSYGKELAKKITATGIKTTLKENRLGHYLSCLFFYLFPKI